MKGKIWTKIIERDDLEVNEAKYDILSSNYNEDNSLNIRVYGESSPDPEFKSIEPQLDDVYFLALKHDEPVLS